MKLPRSFALLYVALCAVPAGAQEVNVDCLARISTEQLRQVSSRSANLAADFKNAFLSMPTAKATENIHMVSATLLGSALANEIDAVSEGLKHLLSARDRFPPLSGKELVEEDVREAMRAASRRLGRVGNSYATVGKMVALPGVAALANRGQGLANGLASEWGCPE